MKVEEIFAERAKQQSMERLRSDLARQVLAYEENMVALKEREPEIRKMEAHLFRIQDILEAEEYPKVALELDFFRHATRDDRYSVFLDTEELEFNDADNDASYVAYPVAISPAATSLSYDLSPHEYVPANFNVIYYVPSRSAFATRPYYNVEEGSRLIARELTIEEQAQAAAEAEARAAGLNVTQTVLTHHRVFSHFEDDKLTLWDYRAPLVFEHISETTERYLTAEHFKTINKQLRQFRPDKRNRINTLSF